MLQIYNDRLVVHLLIYPLVFPWVAPASSLRLPAACRSLWVIPFLTRSSARLGVQRLRPAARRGHPPIQSASSDSRGNADSTTAIRTRHNNLKIAGAWLYPEYAGICCPIRTFREPTKDFNVRICRPHFAFTFGELRYLLRT